MKVLIYILSVTSLPVTADCVKVPVKAIEEVVQKVSRQEGVSACRLKALAAIETSGGRQVCTRSNKNGTKDYGVFQVNSVHKLETCLDLDVKTLEGNTICAARLVKKARIWQVKDDMWLARYHSRTPRLKQAYWKKLKPLLEKCG